MDEIDFMLAWSEMVFLCDIFIIRWRSTQQHEKYSRELKMWYDYANLWILLVRYYYSNYGAISAFETKNEYTAAHDTTRSP